MRAEELSSIQTSKVELIQTRSYRALVISSLILITAVVFGTFRMIILYREGGEFLNLPYVWFLLFIGLMGIYFSRRKRPDIAGYLILFTLAILAIVFAVLFENVFTPFLARLLLLASP